MDERGVVAQVGPRLVTALKWLLYCGAIAVVGGGLVFVLTAVWLGLPVAKLVREASVFGGVGPSVLVVGVLVGACVVVFEADLQSR